MSGRGADARHEAWLEAIERDGTNLTTFEAEFVESIREQIDRGRTLSDKQAEILERIYADRTP
jgi:hypothetical protein